MVRGSWLWRAAGDRDLGDCNAQYDTGTVILGETVVFSAMPVFKIVYLKRQGLLLLSGKKCTCLLNVTSLSLSTYLLSAVKQNL